MQQLRQIGLLPRSSIVIVFIFTRLLSWLDYLRVVLNCSFLHRINISQWECWRVPRVSCCRSLLRRTYITVFQQSARRLASSPSIISQVAVFDVIQDFICLLLEHNSLHICAFASITICLLASFVSCNTQQFWAIWADTRQILIDLVVSGVSLSLASRCH